VATRYEYSHPQTPHHAIPWWTLRQNTTPQNLTNAQSPKISVKIPISCGHILSYLVRTFQKDLIQTNFFSTSGSTVLFACKQVTYSAILHRMLTKSYCINSEVLSPMKICKCVNMDQNRGWEEAVLWRG
jgi:hypothetical protein